jgi:hypothetical protein
MSLMLDTETSLAPISFSEEAVWQKFVADKLVFFNLLFELKIPLPPAADVEFVRRLVNTLVARHAVLRTGYRPSGSSAVRYVLPSFEHGIRVVDEPDFSIHPDPDQVELTPADLVTVWLTGPPGGERFLLFDMNEMICDSWSSGRLYSEIIALLDDPTVTGDGAQPAPALEYAEFAREQRGQQLPEEAEAYWQERLRDARQPDYIVPDGPGATGNPAAERIIIFTDDATENLHRLSRDYRVSSFVAAASLVNMVMAARSGSRDITLATIASIRTRKWTEVLGNFCNVLPLRTVLPADPTFEDVIHLTRDTVRGGMAHKDIPFLQLPAAPDGTRPQPPVRLHYLMNRDHHYDILDVKESGAVWDEYATYATWSIELGFGEDQRRRVSIWVSYDPRLFTRDTVAELLGQCNEVLRVAGANPAMTCSEVARHLGLRDADAG